MIQTAVFFPNAMAALSNQLWAFEIDQKIIEAGFEQKLLNRHPVIFSYKVIFYIINFIITCLRDPLL